MFHWRKSSYLVLICTVKMTTFETVKKKKWYDDMIWDVFCLFIMALFHFCKESYGMLLRVWVD